MGRVGIPGWDSGLGWVGEQGWEGEEVELNVGSEVGLIQGTGVNPLNLTPLGNRLEPATKLPLCLPKARYVGLKLTTRPTGGECRLTVRTDNPHIIL